MTDWRSFLGPKLVNCGKPECRMADPDRNYTIRCEHCGVTDLRASKFWRLFARLSR